MLEMPETYLKVLGFWKIGELEFTLDFHRYPQDTVADNEDCSLIRDGSREL